MSVKSLQGRRTTYATRIKLMKLKYKIRLSDNVQCSSWSHWTARNALPINVN